MGMVKLKIKIWFIYEGVASSNWGITKEVIKLVNEIEKAYNKEMLDLKSIDYNRFMTESKSTNIKKSDLPVVMINDRVLFKKRLPSADELKEEIKKIVGD